MTAESMVARLAKIMGEVGRVEKKGQIRSGGSGGPSYSFARDTDVLEAVIPKLTEAGIVVVPEHTELLSIGPNMRETQLIANIRTSWHVTDGKESIRFETLGQGQDGGDKALPKAQSNARKYAFFMLFHIVTGDDPDQHASESEPRRRSAPGRAGSTEAQPRTPAPADFQNRGQVQQAIAVAAAERSLSFAYIEERSKALGIKRGDASMEELLRLLADIEGRAEPDPMEEVLRVTGGTEVTEPAAARAAAPEAADSPPAAPAPRPRTVEEAIADAESKAKAGVS